MKLNSHSAVAFLTLACSFVLTSTAFAAYPDKPIRLISPYAPGGAAGTLAQIVGKNLSDGLGQPVIVEAKPGANGNIASDFVAHTPSDGYTLLIGTISTLAINPSLYKNMTFNPMKDFAPISQLVTTQNMIVVDPTLPIKTLTDLIQYAKKNPGKLTYGSSGVGSTLHLSGELFRRVTGTEMMHVAYKGGVPARTDLLAGHISMMFGDMSALPFVQSGKLRALAVTSPVRDPAAPSIPTAEEAGLPGYVVVVWYGMFAPVGTPADIVKKLSQTIDSVLKKTDVKSALNEIGMQPAKITTPEYLDNLMKEDFNKWAEVIKAANIKIDQ